MACWVRSGDISGWYDLKDEPGIWRTAAQDILNPSYGMENHEQQTMLGQKTEKLKLGKFVLTFGCTTYVSLPKHFIQTTAV